MRLPHRLLLALALSISMPAAQSQTMQEKPGLQPYIPNRIEWLALVCNDQLRQDMNSDQNFSLNVFNSDHETLQIFVRYFANVDREIMNKSIDTARKVIELTAKSYGWEKWVKIKERVDLAKTSR